MQVFYSFSISDKEIQSIHKTTMILSPVYENQIALNKYKIALIRNYNTAIFNYLRTLRMPEAFSLVIFTL